MTHFSKSYRILSIIALLFGFCLYLEVLHFTFSHPKQPVLGGGKLRLDQTLERLSNIDCCKENCSFKTRVLKKPNCPNKYVSFLPYGDGYDNDLRQLISIVLFGGLLHRTVIIPDNSGFNWAQLLDANEICVEEWTSAEIKKAWAEDARAIRSIFWDSDVSNINEFLTLPIEKVQLDGAYFRKFQFQPDIFCVDQSIPRYHVGDRLLYIPRPLFTGIQRDTYKRVMELLSFPSPVKDAASEFQNSLLSGELYVGIHLPLFEGRTCGDNVHKVYSKPPLDKFLIEALEQCEMPWSYVARKLTETGLDPNSTKIFLATDYQRKATTNHYDLLSRNNIFTWDAAAYPGLDAQAMNMLLLSESSTFIGNPYSPFSFHAAMFREIKGFNSNTNILAGYRETGFLQPIK